MPTATKTLNPLVHRLAKLVESGRVDINQVAEVADTTTLVVTGWLRGNSWPNEVRALAITSLLDSLAKPVLPKFNSKDYYLALGLADSHEYDLLLTARRSLDGTRLKAAMLERNGGRVSGAATAAGVPWAAVGDLDKRAPTMRTLERMLQYVGQPITAYIPVNMEAPSWPKGIIPAVPLAAIWQPETNGTKDSDSALADGSQPTVDKVIPQLPLPSDTQDRVLVPLTEAELAMLPPELLAKILHKLLQN